MDEKKKMPYVALYTEYYEMFEALSDPAVGRLVRALLRYLLTEEEPEWKGSERMLWPVLRSKLQRDQRAYEERCERNRKNGKKGGRPRKMPNDICDLV